MLSPFLARKRALVHQAVLLLLLATFSTASGALCEFLSNFTRSDGVDPCSLSVNSC
jgi:hypothetical protein